MNRLLTLLLAGWVVGGPGAALAQELYVHAEPASTNPLGVWTFRFQMAGGEDDLSAGWSVSATPWPNLTLTGRARTTLDGGRFGSGGAVKYRFLSHDARHRHFRLAVYAEADSAHGQVNWGDWDVGLRRGGGGGLIATGLYGRTALSGTVGLYRAGGARDAAGPHGVLVPFSVSLGRLVLPHRYSGYGQTNLNLYFEVPAVTRAGRFRLEAAPSVQLIVRSRLKVDLSVRRLWRDDFAAGHSPWGGLVAVEWYRF